MTAAAQRLLHEHGPRARAEIGLVLGSGLGALADAVQDAIVADVADLPGFQRPTVSGHAGRLLVGTLAGCRVAVLQGRAHVYEGTPAGQLAVGVRTLHALGVHTLLVTNAAGSLRAEAPPGHLMAITDHINLMGINPLVGPNDDTLGPRFVGMGDAYDAGILDALRAAARTTGVPMGEGVYLAVTGPSFETPAEIRAFRTLGADAVGMSTVPEVIVARHAGLRVGAVSAITNLAEGMGDVPLSHEQTLASAADGAAHLQRLLTAVLPDL